MVNDFALCEDCEFWDYKGGYCFIKDMHNNSGRCKKLTQILNLTDEQGNKLLCIRAGDQSLPEHPPVFYFNGDPQEQKRLVDQAQQDMLKAGFVKVVQE